VLLSRPSLSAATILFFERYDDSSNFLTGLGAAELWLSIQP